MKNWMISTSKEKKEKITNSAKELVSKEAYDLINHILKPLHIKPEKENNCVNQLFDIDLKWCGNSLYF